MCECRKTRDKSFTVGRKTIVVHAPRTKDEAPKYDHPHDPTPNNRDTCFKCGETHDDWSPEAREAALEARRKANPGRGVSESAPSRGAKESEVRGAGHIRKALEHLNGNANPSEEDIYNAVSKAAPDYTSAPQMGEVEEKVTQHLAKNKAGGGGSPEAHEAEAKRLSLEPEHGVSAGKGRFAGELPAHAANHEALKNAGYHQMNGWSNFYVNGRGNSVITNKKGEWTHTRTVPRGEGHPAGWTKAETTKTSRSPSELAKHLAEN
jgi:hypothetical protein